MTPHPPRPCLLTEVETAARLGYGYIADFRRDLRRGLVPRPTHGDARRPKWSDTALDRFLRPDAEPARSADEQDLLARLGS